MKKTILLTLLVIITIASVLIGTYIHTKPFFEAVTHRFEKNIKNTDFESIVLNNKINITQKDIESVFIDIDIGDVSIVSGDSFTVSYDCNHEYLKPIIESSDKKLNIKQNNHIKTGPKTKHCNILITIPDDFSFNVIKVQNDIGQIKIRDTKSSGLIVHTDIGEVKIIDCKFDNADVQTDIGEVQIKGLDSQSSHCYKLRRDIGNISLFGNNYSSFISENIDESKLIKVTTNIGAINIS